ncbi:hypothetical protein T261_5813 [Streptomyces lydicus]|nr:hypothetical protein T261_5813 [Streptomyces lydicus]
MAEIDEIRAAILPKDSPEPAGAQTYHPGDKIPQGQRVKVRPFLHIISPTSGVAMHSVRFAKTRRATVTTDYDGSILLSVQFEDEFVAQQANGAGYKHAELHKLECACTACS